MIDYPNASRNILALVGKLSPAVQVRQIEAKIKECKKSLTETRLDIEIDALETANRK